MSKLIKFNLIIIICLSLYSCLQVKEVKKNVIVIELPSNGFSFNPISRYKLRKIINKKFESDYDLDYIRLRKIYYKKEVGVYYIQEKARSVSGNCRNTFIILRKGMELFLYDHQQDTSFILSQYDTLVGSNSSFETRSTIDSLVRRNICRGRNW